MQTLRSIGIVLVSGMAFGLGCQLIAGVNTDATYAEGSGGSGGNGGSGGTGGATVTAGSSTSGGGMGGMGGMGGSPACTTVNDCISEECKIATACDNGVCVWQDIGENLKAPSQIYGDCKDRVCDGNGGVKSIENDKDAYDWGNPCYYDLCDAISMPTPHNGVTCTTAWDKAGTCNGFVCVECTIDSNCSPANVCLGIRCVPMTCMDGMVSGGETDIDCGGFDCSPCSVSQTCAINSDCEGSCDLATMKCLVPSCVDALRNGDETDVDCGGGCALEMPPKKCAPFKKCLFPNDCDSGVCKVGQCQEPMCNDYTLNQGEEAIDCGGPCPPCPVP